MAESRVLLLRHAETSAPDRFHGAESVVGLGERGLEQAEAVAKLLAKERPDALTTSAMRRALETAGPIARECGLETRVEPALHERKMGHLSGMSREEGLSFYHATKERWKAGDLEYTHAGGESYGDIRRRVAPIFERLAETSVGRTIVVVAHGVVIRVFLTTILEGFGPEDFDRFAIDNTALNDLRWDQTRWKAVVLNRKVGSNFDSFAW